MIFAIISLMFSLMIGCMGLMLQLGLWLLQAFIVVVLDISAIIVEFILSLIGAGCGATCRLVGNSKAVETTSVFKHVPAKETHRSLSRRERKEIEKSVGREIQKARDDMVYDMLMMMEVCADD